MTTGYQREEDQMTSCTCSARKLRFSPPRLLVRCGGERVLEGADQQKAVGLKLVVFCLDNNVMEENEDIQ